MLRPSILNLGSEAALHVLAEANALRAKGREINMLCVGQPDFPPPDCVLEAAQRAARDGPHGYTDPAGLPALREALAAHHENDAGRPLDPGRFVITPGAKPTAWLALLMLCEPGAEIIIPDPFFPVYEAGINFMGATPVPLPLREKEDFAVRPRDLENLISDKTRLILLNSPANPTGAMLSADAVRAISELVAARPGLHLLSDEIYDRILLGETPHRSFLAQDALDAQLIYLNGFSKTYAMTGWRVGYGYWPSKLAEYAARLTTNAHSCVNGVAQMAALAALQGPQTQVQEMCDAFAQRAKAAKNALDAIPGISCMAPKGAFYLFPKIEVANMNSAEVCRALLYDHGVAVAPGTSFGAQSDGRIRLSIAAPQTEILIGIERLAQFLKAHPIAPSCV